MPQAAANVSSKVAAPAPPKQPVWRWAGKTRQGEQRAGEMEAPDQAAVRARLTQMGIEPVRVRRKLSDIELRLPGLGGIGTKDILVFTRQFSVMIDAGLP